MKHVSASSSYDKVGDQTLLAIETHYSWNSQQRPPWGQKKVAVVWERFKQESMYELSAPKSGRWTEISRCEEVAASGVSTLQPLRIRKLKQKIHPDFNPTRSHKGHGSFKRIITPNFGDRHFRNIVYFFQKDAEQVFNCRMDL